MAFSARPSLADMPVTLLFVRSRHQDSPTSTGLFAIHHTDGLHGLLLSEDALEFCSRRRLKYLLNAINLEESTTYSLSALSLTGLRSGFTSSIKGSITLSSSNDLPPSRIGYSPYTFRMAYQSLMPFATISFTKSSASLGMVARYPRTVPGNKERLPITHSFNQVILSLTED